MRCQILRRFNGFDPSAFALKSLFASTLGLAVTFATNLNAQEIQIISSASSAFVDGEEGDGETSAAKIGFSFSTPTASFSFGGTPEDPSDPAGLVSLLEMESIRQELKISDEQLAGIRKLQSESSRLMREAISTMNVANLVQSATSKPAAGDEPQSKVAPVKIDATGLREKIKQAREEVQRLNTNAIEEILLPDQLTRIRQIASQVEISKMGLGPALTRGKLGQELKVRPEQKPDLIRLAKRLDEETKAKILELKRQAREELLSSLDPEQLVQANELLGEFFDYAAPTMDDISRRMMNSFKPKKADTEEEAGDKPR